MEQSCFERAQKSRLRSQQERHGNRIWQSSKMLVDNAEHEKEKWDTAFDLVSSPQEKGQPKMEKQGNKGKNDKKDKRKQERKGEKRKQGKVGDSL